MMKCPNCGKISPDENSKCNCGYLFPTMVKWTFAAIPAMIIIAIIVAFVMMLLGGVTTSLINS